MTDDYDAPEFRHTPAEFKAWLHADAAALAALDAGVPTDPVDHWFYLNARRTRLAGLEETSSLLVKAYDAADDPAAGTAAEELHEHYAAALQAAERAVEDARPAAVRLLQPHLSEPDIEL